jgi:heme/copper-type cytochrome/quinol oxidase subunit 3
LPRLIRFGLFGYKKKIYFYLFYIVGELAFITYGHHALIAGNRKAAIDGVILTIILAVIFTALQYFEYSEAGFTISDGVYGSAFYASTGLHGLITIVPIKLKICLIHQIFKILIITLLTLFLQLKMVILLLNLITLKNKKKFY